MELEKELELEGEKEEELGEEGGSWKAFRLGCGLSRWANALLCP